MNHFCECDNEDITKSCPCRGQVNIVESLVNPFRINRIESIVANVEKVLGDVSKVDFRRRHGPR